MIPILRPPPVDTGSAWWIHCRDDLHAAGEGARMVLDAFVAGAGEHRVALALSGGRIAPLFYAELIRQSAARRCRLADAEFFWADERCVPPEHPDSNFRLAQEHLLLPVSVPDARIHRLQGEEPTEVAAANANDDWDRWCASRPAGSACLDCVVLGVGEDGHVASLFPGNLATDLASPVPFRHVQGPKPPPDRLTMGYTMLWAARRLVILAVGKGKWSVVSQALSGQQDSPLRRVVTGCRPGAVAVVTAGPREPI